MVGPYKPTVKLVGGDIPALFPVMKNTRRLQMSTSAVSVMLKSASALPGWCFTVSFFLNSHQKSSK